MAGANVGKDSYLGITFESVFKITHKCLLVNGAHPFIKRDLRWLVHYVTGMTVIWFLTSFVLYSIVHSVRSGDLMEACRNGNISIVTFVISFKYIIMLVHQDNILEIIRALEKDYERACGLSIEEKNIVKLYAERGVWVSKLWFVVGCVTSSLFPLKALFLMIYYAMIGDFRKVMVFEVILPLYDDRKYETNFFIVLTMVSVFFTFYAATVYVSFDPLPPIFMLHFCGQLELVKIQIGRLFPENEECNPVEIKERLNCIIDHLNQIYRFGHKMRTNFTIAYEMILKFTTILIPITLYLIVELLKENSIFLEFISFFFGCLVHFYVPCYYSDLLMEKSISTAEAVYACNWERHWVGADTRKTLAIMMIRAQRPLAITTAFNIICLNSFAEMCRESYTLFNLLNASIK